MSLGFTLRNNSMGTDTVVDSPPSQDAQPSNHIQIQMIYPSNFGGNCAVRTQIATMSELLEHNNKAIMQLIEKSQTIEGNLQSIERLLRERKLKQKQSCQQMNHPQTTHIEDYSNYLIEKIFCRSNFKYSLILADPLPKTLYKERNFSLNVLLVDNTSNLVSNTNHIPISLCSYTSDIEPQMLHENKSGKSIFRGNHETQLVLGTATFNKIQFRQVTSYYKNGWIHFVIYPKPLPFSYQTRECPYERFIEWQHIKPLVISEIVVKAKKKL